MGDLIKSLWQLVESINAGHYAVDHVDANTVGDAIEKIESLRDDVAAWKNEADGFRKNRDALSKELAECQKQNRSLKEALIGWRQRAWPGTDQRAVVEKDYPAMGEQHGN